jgi:hypothetical protein
MGAVPEEISDSFREPFDYTPAHPRRDPQRQRSPLLRLHAFYATDAPFGGYEESGIGRQMGIEGFERGLETRTVLAHSTGA